MTRGNDDLHFFYDAQNRPAVVVYNGTAYAYVKNLQGDIIAILDSTGAVVVSYTYDAWGTPTSIGGNMAASLGVLNPFRYRGYVFDEETGLYYLRSRFYRPNTLRFINADALCGNNQFAYCKNSPIAFSDDSGYTCVCCLDENGLETTLMTTFALGGGGGGARAVTSVGMSFSKEMSTSKEYALYDSHRFNKDSAFHEQIGVVTLDAPSLSLPAGKVSAGAEFDLITGGWEYGNEDFSADLSLLDAGHAELGATFAPFELNFEFTAMASLWSPSASITIFGVEFSIGAEVGAFGMGVDADLSYSGGICIEGALGMGFNIAIDW